MKKLIFLILSILTITAFSQNKVNIVVTKIDNMTVASKVYPLNSENILLVKKVSNTASMLWYKNTKTNKVNLISSTTKIDTIVKYSNVYVPTLVKLRRAWLDSTYVSYAFNIRAIVDWQTATSSQYGLTHSKVFIKLDRVKFLEVVDTRPRYDYMVDSLYRVQQSNIFLNNRKVDTQWVKHGNQDTVYYKINGTTHYDTIKRPKP